MPERSAGKLQLLLEAANMKVRWYSGRAMYGEVCLGVDVDGPSDLLVAIAEGVTDDNREEVVAALERARHDAMGRGTVVYFPGTRFVGEEEDEEESDAAE